MKKATIARGDVVDMLAKTYEDKDQIGTIMEVIVKTRAEVGERVKIEELAAERGVISSRWVKSTKVVLFRADEWQYLRGTKWLEPHLLDKVRQLTL